MRADADDIRSRAAAASRRTTELRLYLDVQIVLGETHQSAMEKLEMLKADIYVDGALAKLSGDIGYDFSQLALDDELTDIDVPSIRGQFDALRGIKVVSRLPYATPLRPTRSALPLHYS